MSTRNGMTTGIFVPLSSFVTMYHNLFFINGMKNFRCCLLCNKSKIGIHLTKPPEFCFSVWQRGHKI